VPQTHGNLKAQCLVNTVDETLKMEVLDFATVAWAEDCHEAAKRQQSVIHDAQIELLVSDVSLTGHNTTN
jgi:hypothetical protein